MTTEEILARCISEIEHGVSIDECLSQYPENAEELRPLLELALTFRSTQPVRMPDRAFDRGRRMLQQQMTQSTVVRHRSPFLHRSPRPAASRKVILPSHDTAPSLAEPVRRRNPQSYFVWVSAASSVIVVTLGVFLFTRLSNFNIAPPTPQQPFVAVPTYTATAADTATLAAPNIPINYTPAEPTATDTPTADATATLIPAGQFIPSTPTQANTFTPILQPINTVEGVASPVNTALPTQSVAPATATTKPTQPSVPEASTTPILAPTTTPTLMPTSTATMTPTATLTATPTETATVETPTATETLTPPTPPPPPATATETPLEATPTATFIYGPIATVEITITPADPGNGMVGRSSSTPTPHSTPIPRPPHDTPEPDAHAHLQSFGKVW